MDPNTQIQEILQSLFDGLEWPSCRKYIRSKAERTPFVTANILEILRHCRITDTALKHSCDLAAEHLNSYRVGHRGYNWPIQEGMSVMGNSRFWGKLNFFSLSPDADDSCLIQLASPDSTFHPKIHADLKHFRLDGRNFRIVSYQRRLPALDGVFLTWWPVSTGDPHWHVKNRLRHRPQKDGARLESVDVCVLTNILLYLAQTGSLDIPGGNATIQYVEKLVQSGLITDSPFTVSPYYPNPAAILFHIARTARWGSVSFSEITLGQLANLAEGLTPKTQLDQIFLLCIGLFLKSELLIVKYLSACSSASMNPCPYYQISFATPLLNRFPNLEFLVKLSWARISLSSAAFQWAMVLWARQELTAQGYELPV